MVRGSGVDHDLRRDQSYEIYNTLELHIPVSAGGDCYDRYFLRIEEMRQSVKILLQAINRISSGPIKSDNQKISIPGRLQLRQSMEAIIHHFKLFSEGFTVPAVEKYIGTEAPKGEFGLYLAADSTAQPNRLKIRAPGFFHLQGIDFMIEGHLLADVVTAIGTQDIVFGEVDR
jgi:NADH-quinone oxidoreductase subunit D